MGRLTDTEKRALAQLFKRITWADIRCNAASDYEARCMVDAVAKMQAILAEMGFAPR